MILIGTERSSDHSTEIGEVSVLYYWGKETGDSKRPSLRVVAVEALWETLMDAYEQMCRGGGPDWRNA